MPSSLTLTPKTTMTLAAVMPHVGLHPHVGLYPSGASGLTPEGVSSLSLAAKTPGALTLTPNP